MNIIIGQYLPGNSMIHRLDPRTKITIIFFFVIFVFFANNLYSYSLLTGFTLLAIIITRIPIRYIIRGLLPIWFLIVFTFLLHLLFTKDGNVLVEVFSFKIHVGGVLRGFEISLRFFLFIMMTSLLSFTTRSEERRVGKECR